MSPGSANGRPPEGPVLVALLAGVVLGVAIALLLQAVSARTATPLSPTRALWQLGLWGLAGGLSGFAISAVRALQASNPDPDYHRARRPRPLSPPRRRRP